MGSLVALVFGKIIVEAPKYQVLHSAAHYEVRRYGPAVVAQVTYDPKDMNGDPDGGFKLLTDYIGAFGAPKNTKSTAGSERVAMTVPVVTKSSHQPEEIAMTVPVITDGVKDLVTMQFILPSKYARAEEAPRPTDERVVIKEQGESKYGVVKFSGVATDAVTKDKAAKLKAILEKDGFTVTGDHLLARYNPSWSLPPLRTNEVFIPVA